MESLSAKRIFRIMLTIAALAVGVAWIWITGHPNIENPADIPSNQMIICAALGLLVGIFPLTSRRITRFTNQLDQTAGSRRVYIAIGIGLFTSLFLLGFNLYIGRPLMLSWHDEHQFFLQTQMVARFKLWMPPHPLGDFFETFYVFMQPVYASQSFPGAAILFAPTVWFHLPTWVMPILCVGACAAMMWWLTARCINPTAATIGWIAFVSIDQISFLSTMFLAQFAVLMLGLIALIASVKYVEAQKLRWAAIIGVTLGWAAITRPLDALIFAIPVAIYLLHGLKTIPIKRYLRAAAICIVASLPFIAIQLIFDYRITGKWLQTPFSYYNQLDQPALAYGNANRLNVPAKTKNPEKIAFYEFFTKSSVEEYLQTRYSPIEHWKSRYGMIEGMLSPIVYLMPLLFVGLTGISSRLKLCLFLLLPLFLIGYHFYPIFLYHYAICIMPVIVILFATAFERIKIDFHSSWVSSANIFIGLFIGVCVGFQIQRTFLGSFTNIYQAYYDTQTSIANRIHQPAIVLFKWSHSFKDKEDYLHYEPVYNDDVAWPDDAPVIRAHDLSDRDIELYRYYASRQPLREVWSYDRSTGKLIQLGNVETLAENWVKK